MITTVTLNAAVDKRYVIEKFEFGTAMRIKSCSITAGGKGINVARAAAIAGEKVTATGFAGGRAGEYIICELNKQSVDTKFVMTDGETRTNINFFDEFTGVQSQFLEQGISVSDKQTEDFISLYTASIKTSDVVAICGSLPNGIKADFYCKLINIAKAEGKKVILDTSGKPLAEGIKAKPYMIKPNLDEINELLNIKIQNEKQLISAAKSLYDGGIEIVAVSLGKDGAVFVCDNSIFVARTAKITPVNTLGCGDCMVAAFAAGLSNKLPFEEIIKNAMAISAANALSEQSGYYTKDDFNKLIKQVSVIKL